MAWVWQGMEEQDAESGSQASHVLTIPLHPDPNYSLNEGVVSYKRNYTFLTKPIQPTQFHLARGIAYTYQPRVLRNETKANIFCHEVNEDIVSVLL